MTYSDDRLAAGLVALIKAEEGHNLPRRSPFVFSLTAAERRELAARARNYTSPYRDVIRAKIVLLAATGLGNDEIGARLDTPRQIVSKWRHRFFHDRLAGSTRSRAAGVQPAFPPNVIVEVKRIACERPMGAGVPLARWSLTELHREVLTRGVVATISGTTL